MKDWINFYYIFIGSAALLISILALWFTAIMPGIDRWSRRFFRIFFLVLMLSCFFSIFEMAMHFYPVPDQAIVIMLTLMTQLLSLLLPMLTVLLLHCSGEALRSSRLLYTVLALWAVSFLLLAVAPFAGDFGYVMPDKAYRRGPRYPLLVLPLVAIMLLNLAGTFQRRNQFSKKLFRCFLIALLPMTLALIVHMFVEVFPLVDISIVLSALSMYGLIMSDQIEQDLQHQREIARHQQEIANQRASILVLQMRPHFIYNTMTSIYCLCRQDPEKARQVVLDFTTYLRKNFTAIASSEPIPFSAELEHTRAYLNVELAQYEESLSVDYDTPHIRFRVPPLTLQPIVEIAVKHGRDPFAGMFHISIQTRKTDTGSEIIVSNNGRGFSPSDDNEPHIALKNIQQRLELMCGGSLTVTQGDGGGTRVTITIPDIAAIEVPDIAE